MKLSAQSPDQLSLTNLHRCPMFNDQPLVENILDEEREQLKLKEERAEPKKCSPKDALRLAVVVLLVVFMCTVTYLESKNLNAYIKWISDKTQLYVNQRSVVSYLVYLAFQLAFHLLFVPGLTFFNVLVGYYMESTVEAFFVVYVPSVLACMLTYFVANGLFKDYFERTIFRKDIFSHMLKISEHSPWQASFITRVLFIPVAYKNYGIALLRINFWHYSLPAILFYVPYLLFMVLVGASMNSFEQIYSERSWKDMSKADKWKFGFTMSLMFVTVLIMVYFIYYTVKVFRRIRREIRERKELEANQASVKPVSHSRDEAQTEQAATA